VLKPIALVLASAGALLLAVTAFAAPPAASPDLSIIVQPAPKPVSDKASVDFANEAAVLDLKDALASYHAPSGPEPDGSLWYLVTAVNNAVRPATRILIAGEPAGAGLRIFPRPARPGLRQIASSDAGVTVESARAYGRHSYRVTIPPATSVSLALRVSYGDATPSILAWTEPALVAHNRQLASFVAAVAGLIAAAFVITAGLAAMTGHMAPRWAALTLGGVFLTRLASGGVFDGFVTAVGGPYGLSAMLAGLSLATGMKLADIIVPVEPWLAGGNRYLRLALAGISALSVFAFLGFPGAALLINIIVVPGTACLAAYLVHRGRLGVQAARVVAPAAAVFSLVAFAAAVTAAGGFQDNPMAPAIVGGFAAAGAVLLALAVAAGEGIAILPAMRVAVAIPSAQAKPVSKEPPPAPPPVVAPPQQIVSPAALQAIGASHQGIFELDFHADTLRLPAETAALIGLADGAQNMPHVAWIARVHPDDRGTYKEALLDYRGHPGLAFRIEFRLRSESGRYPWFELRATMLGEGAAASRCLGLIADVTTRKETEAAMVDRTLHDSLTGLGNRVALMEEMEQLGARLKQTIFALLDIDRFKAIHSSLGDVGGDSVLAGMAERLTKRFDGIAEVFRVGGDAFAVLFTKAGSDAAAIGADLMEACQAPLIVNGKNVFAPASVGVAAGAQAEDPLELLKNAELALIQAKREGGSCARIYSTEYEALAPADTVSLEADLRHALDEGELDLFYQPIMRLEDETVAGFEALLRWRHPQKGLVEPADFVAHSEESGLIVSLGRFALERAALDLSYWQRFFPLDEPLFASVNLSRRQLQDSGLEAFLGALLKDGEIEPGTLKLEVTESAVGASGDGTAMLTRLRAMGAGLAIDDFGTGLSTLSQLKDIPFDTVKIDKTFLVRDAGSGDAAKILSSVVTLAHELGRAVVVEGVESARDAGWLKSLGCEFAQGFHYSEPLPASEALNFIALHHRTPSKGGSGPPGVGG
jgi:diguanylate cyclase (GGDEF)-like protein